MTVTKASREFVVLMKNQQNDPQYQQFESEEDSSKIVSELSLFGRLFPDCVLMLCNRSHPKLQWVSDNCSYLFGMSASQFMKLPVTDFFSLLHPDDLTYVTQCFEFINSSEPYDPMVHRFVMYYRLRNSDGEYMHLRDEKLAIETAEGKYIYFTMFKNITSQEKFFNVKLDVMRFKRGNAVKVYTYNPRHADHSMTPRQNDIAKLIIQGLSNLEIAGRLNVSINTVKNHKRALFQKVNVRSSVQLVNALSDNSQLA